MKDMKTGGLVRSRLLVWQAKTEKARKEDRPVVDFSYGRHKLKRYVHRRTICSRLNRAGKN
jgi:hypothetical protein